MKRLMTGLEALARAAAEEGVALLAAQAGPAVQGLAAAALREGLRCEVAPGARVALDLAAGASLARGRAIAAVGDLFAAAEPLRGAVLSGLSGLVVVAVDDPGLAERGLAGDARALARALDLPCLEPGDAAECAEHLRAALLLSERWETPVLLRLTARIARGARPVELGAARPPAVEGLRARPERHALGPARAPAARARVGERLAQLAAEGVESPLNRVELRSTALGVVTSGAAYGHVREGLPDASVLKLGISFPLPSELVRDFAGRVERLLVVEELAPVVESDVRGLGIACRGKDLLPRSGELSPELLRRAVAGGAPCRVEAPFVPERPPEACAGCPQRGISLAAKRLHLAVVGDPGCTVLFSDAPLAPVDRALAPGSAAALLHGAALALGERARGRQVALLGAAELFVEGLPGIAHLAASGAPAVVVVADDGGGPSFHDLAAVARGLGAARVVEADAFDVAAVEAALRAALPEPGLSVLVARGRCPVASPRAHGIMQVAEERCNRCGACLRLGCPAISDAFDAMAVDAALCQGCGVCAQACRAGALALREERP